VDRKELGRNDWVRRELDKSVVPDVLAELMLDEGNA
jgi:hypothetical protein